MQRIKKTFGFLRGSWIWRLLKIVYNDWRSRDEFARLRGAGQSADLRILVINHYFDGELESLAAELNGGSEVSIAAISPEPLFSRAVAWFPDAVQRAEMPYDDPSLDAVKARYRIFCRALFRRIAAAYPFDCVITPSDCFYWIREFIAACREDGVVTIVADKEGMISPRSYASEPRRIRALFPPVADWFFVWSARQLQFWRNAGVTSERLRIVGSARSDLFVNLRLSAAPDTVLVFDFDADAYINNMDWDQIGWTGDRTWREFRLGFYRQISREAREFPAIRFLIKCHPQQVHTDFPDVGLTDLPNVAIIRGAPRGLPALVANAKVVVGFQTTALVEAALAGVPVLYAAWGDLYRAVASRILPWHEPGYGLEWIESEQRLGTRIQELLSSSVRPATPDASRLSTYFHSADGQVARRLLAAAREVARVSEARVAVH